MASASIGINTARIKFSFQVDEVWSINSATFLDGSGIKQAIGLFACDLSNQLSSQILVDSPSPILRTKP